MKKVLVRKFLPLSVMMAFTATTLVTSTYAFIVLSNEASVDEFEYKVEAQKGLNISLDNATYYQDISTSIINNEICNTVDNPINLTPVTPSHGDTEGTYKRSNGYIGFSKNDLVRHYDDETFTRSYRYVLNDSEKNKDYISFDLYFQVVDTDKESHPTYNLKMTNRTFIHSTKEELTLRNQAQMIMRANPAEVLSKKTGDTIDVNVSNAMRLGLDLGDSVCVYEIVDEYDHGSAAIEGSTNPLNQKDSNLMYTYHNAVESTYQFTSAASDHESFQNTYSTYNGNVLGTFTYDETTGYNTVHMVAYIWLEGWDADYIPGISYTAKDLTATLEFELVAA